MDTVKPEPTFPVAPVIVDVRDVTLGNITIANAKAVITRIMRDSQDVPKVGVAAFSSSI